jgi:hypothetical protein
MEPLTTQAAINRPLAQQMLTNEVKCPRTAMGQISAAYEVVKVWKTVHQQRSGGATVGLPPQGIPHRIPPAINISIDWAKTRMKIVAIILAIAQR